MSDDRKLQGRSEETVVPVHRPQAVGDSDHAEAEGRRFGPVLVGLTALLLVAGLVVVFAYLPGRVERAQSVEPIATDVDLEVEAEPVEPPLSAEERQELRERAEEYVVQLLEQREELNARSVESWGGATWEEYIEGARLADDALLADELREAVRLYEDTFAAGEELFAESQRIMADALAAGEEAIAVGNPELAQTQFELVLAVDPDNREAGQGLERAQALPGVLDAMRRGDELTSQGQLEAAAAAYREALDIDSDWATARTAYDEVTARIAQNRFDALITDGFTALDEGRFDSAIESFESASRMRPDSIAARDGLDQAEQGQLLNSIVIAEVRGMAFERRELWDEAMSRYREALDVDPTLSFAIEGLARAQSRADLFAKLQTLIESPQLLLSEEVLEDAENVMVEAQAVVDPGPTHLSQVDQLAALIDLASTPIAVTLVSDDATEVTVYRVGELGTFTTRELSLKPGQYTAVGARRGYRDVRQPFTVLPGRENGPITIVCVEPI